MEFFPGIVRTTHVDAEAQLQLFLGRHTDGFSENFCLPIFTFKSFRPENFLLQMISNLHVVRGSKTRAKNVENLLKNFHFKWFLLTSPAERAQKLFLNSGGENFFKKMPTFWRFPIKFNHFLPFSKKYTFAKIWHF